MTSVETVIVLATYNGEKWLSQQIQSIQAQSVTDWLLLVSDDGSVDGSVDIVRTAAAQDSRITLLPCRNGPSSHVANFEYLLAAACESGAKYVYLCDQDDLWDSRKLHVVSQLLRRELDRSALVFSDLKIIDADGVSRGGYFQSRALEGKYQPRALLQENAFIGCALAVNSELLQIAMPFPSRLQNHDWWLGICASAVDGIKISKEQLVHYRQHESNAIGIPKLRTQVLRLPQIVARQRRVLESKSLAVVELIARLQEAGLCVPEALIAYRAYSEKTYGWRRPWQLLRSEFRPRSKALLFTQFLASFPLARSGRS